MKVSIRCSQRSDWCLDIAAVETDQLCDIFDNIDALVIGCGCIVDGIDRDENSGNC